MMDDWPCLAKWSCSYLKEQFGDGLISVDVTPAGHGDCVHQTPEGEKFVQPEQRQMKFGEFLDVIKKKREADGVYYVQKQNDNWRKEFKESLLTPDVPDNVQRWGEEIFGLEADAINFWMGDDSAFSSLHKDFYENLYCVVKGQKKTYPSAHFSFDPQTKEWSIVDDVDEDDPEKKVEVPWIEPNVDNPIHYKKFPDLKYTSPLHVRVKEGEVLYLPSLIYHQVGQQVVPTAQDEEESDDFDEFHLKPDQDQEAQQENPSAEAVIAINYWFDMKFDMKYNYYKLVDTLVKANYFEPSQDTQEKTEA